MEPSQHNNNEVEDDKVVIQVWQETIQTFLKKESSGGILLMIATALALIIANSPLSSYYHDIWNAKINISVGALAVNKPSLLWINDGLMAIFFLLVGLELKREILEGELSNFKQAMLPTFAAVGGMLVPALIYVAFNYDNAYALHGWAVPAATDIAFALGVLSLLGKRVPLALKTFLVSLAIIDDVGAIVIIAIFYTNEIAFMPLLYAAASIAILAIMNTFRVRSMSAYILVGIILWVAVLKSGVHATLAGVALAMFIPLRTRHLKNSLARRLEYDLHAPVAYWVLPLFAFANAGLDLSIITLDSFTQPIPLGILLGLFVGKQLGVFTFAWLAVKINVAAVPKGIAWKELYGTAILTGIGFTMSLFISGLAFDPALAPPGADMFHVDRVGIFVGSLLSAVVGYIFLDRVLKK